MPENTFEAFQNSISQGIKYLEFDVHLTLDQVVVVAHDFDLTRPCEVDPNGKKLIGDLNFKDLPPLRDTFITGVWQDQRYTAPVGQDKQFKICKLEDLFKTLSEL